MRPGALSFRILRELKRFSGVDNIREKRQAVP